MKLATIQNDTRDGRLVVVSDDLSRYKTVPDICRTFQQALDNWQEVESQLAGVAQSLNAGTCESQPFQEAKVMSPLPRAFQWLDGSAYVNHVELVRQARGAVLPENFWHDPLMYQGGSDTFIGPQEDIVVTDEAYGIDMEGEIAVIVNDVPMQPTREQAEKAILFVMLVNDVSLRNLIPAELAKGFGFVQSKASSAFSPVAVSVDALGDYWQKGKLNLTLNVDLNGQPFGRVEAGEQMTFDMAELVMHAAKTRKLSAGTIIGSGTISNRDADNSPGRPVADGGRGYSCIAEQRMVETILHGEAKTSFMKFGDTVSIEMLNNAGQSIFGRIHQKVVKA